MSNEPDQEPESETAPDGQSFDPYSEFLSLPPGPRPPNLYQLLEIELFCPHPEQIRQAVRNKFRVIKQFEECQDRPVREAIQDVMTHIATAGVVLTDPEQKQQYDEMLSQRLNIDRDRLLSSRPAARIPEYELVVTAGPSCVGTRLELLPDRTITIGRDPRCDLTLPSTRMSKEHCRLTYLDEHWSLQTAGMDDVMLVNDQRCAEFRLADGDVIDAGGYRLRFGQLGVRRPDPRLLPPPMSMIIRSGPSAPEPILNALPPTSILIGHCETALWQLAGHMVSRHHARVSSQGALWEIEDLQSTNGTMVNGEAVSQSVLRHRDHITIGNFDIQVSLRR